MPTPSYVVAPGSAADLIDHAAGIVAAKMREPHTAPYHWAGALWEAGMLVAPGTSDPAATARIEALEARLEWIEAAATRVRELHREHEGRCVACVEWCNCAPAQSVAYCAHGNVPYPCPTIVALDGAA